MVREPAPRHCDPYWKLVTLKGSGLVTLGRPGRPRTETRGWGDVGLGRPELPRIFSQEGWWNPVSPVSALPRIVLSCLLFLRPLLAFLL